MANYTVTALKMGTLYAEKSSLTMGRDFAKPVDIPMWAALVEGNGIRALVDTGIHDIDWVRKTVGDQYRVTQEDDETMEGALKAVGLTPDDINIVVNTHLHYDHAGNNRLFKKAVFYTQRVEWEYSFDSIENQKVYYGHFLYDWEAVAYPKWKMLDGEFEVAPGFVIIPLPGHTPGCQGTLITTDEGVLCCGGDAVNTVENVNEHVLPNIIYDCEIGYKSLASVRARADRIFPGHDAAIKKYQKSDYPKIIGGGQA
jgi:glyoxylase-like metal-dependent hydrolase (beta-lactamase superfamily II)